MSTRVYVGRISHRARDRDVERLFRSYGKIREIVFKNGYGFVEFEDNRDADDAVYELNGKDLCGERLIVEHARGTARGKDRFTGIGGGGRSDDYRRSAGSSRTPSWLDKYGPPTRTEYRLIVENLSSRVSWQDLKDYMRQAGEVTYADAHKDRKNEGVVEFATYSDMKTALEKLDGTEINGRNIKLVEEKPKKRSHSRSRSRSKSARSRSRSRSPRRSRSRSKSKSRSHEKSRSKSPKQRSPRSSPKQGRSLLPPKRSTTPPKQAKSPKRARSRSSKGSRSISPEESRSRSPKRSKNHNGSASPKPVSRSASRSPSPAPPAAATAKSASRSRSPALSRSRSASPDSEVKSGGSRSRSQSHSRSVSPAMDNGDDSD